MYVCMYVYTYIYIYIYIFNITHSNLIVMYCSFLEMFRSDRSSDSS